MTGFLLANFHRVLIEWKNNFRQLLNVHGVNNAGGSVIECLLSFGLELSPCFPSKPIKIKIHYTIILPVVLFMCETWSFTLSEEHRLKVLRMTFGF